MGARSYSSGSLALWWAISLASYLLHFEIVHTELVQQPSKDSECTESIPISKIVITMLTESFIAATLNTEHPTNSTVLGIHFHDFQPNPALKSTFKKSSVKPNCVAVSDSHIFAAQADKAVVQVYSRERNNQEAIVPFSERIHSIALAGERDGAGILVLGMDGGRLVLWEVWFMCIDFNVRYSPI